MKREHAGARRTVGRGALGAAMLVGWLVSSEAAARADSPFVAKSPTEIQTMRTELMSSLYRRGSFDEAVKLEKVLDGGAIVLLPDSDDCPLRVQAVNSSYQTRWDVAVPLSRFKMTGETATMMRLPLVPARSAANIFIRCSSASPPVVLTAGSVLDAGVARRLQKARADFTVTGGHFEPGGDGKTSQAAALLPLLDASQLREFARVNPAGLDWEKLVGADADPALVKALIGEVPKARLGATLRRLTPEQAAGALEELDPARFAVACDALRATPEGRASLRRLAAATTSIEKFEEVTGARNGLESERSALLEALAQSEANSTAEVKVDYFTAVLGRVAAADRPAVALALLRLAAQGKVQITNLITRVSELAPSAGKEGEEAITKAVEEESTVIAPSAVLAAAKAGQVKALDFLAFNHNVIVDARHCANKDSIAGCAAGIRENYGAIARGHLRPDFQSTLATSAAELLDGHGEPAPVAYWSALAQFGAWGFDVKPLVARLCERAILADELHNPTEDLVTAAFALDPASECGTQLETRRSRRHLGELVVAAAELAFSPVPFVLVFFIGRRRWRAVRQTLVTGGAAAAGASQAQAASARLRANWQRAFDGALGQARRVLDDDPSPEARAAAQAFARLTAGPSTPIAERARQIALDALETGELRSFLAKLDGIALYVLVFPARSDQPQALRRYEPFARGYGAHQAALDEAVWARDPGLPVLSLLFFVRSDVKDGALLLGYDDARHHLLPGALLDGREARTAVGRVHPERIALELG